MKLLLLFVLLLGSVVPAYAQRDKMGWPDYTLLAVATGFIILDWGQTLEIARYPLKYQETNPLLGKHPSVGRVNTMLALGLVLNLGVSRLHNKHLRRTVWAGVTGAEGQAVMSNFNLGIRVKF